MLTPGGLITTGLEEGRLGKALEQLTEQEEPVSPAQQAQILVDQLRQLGIIEYNNMIICKYHWIEYKDN